LVADLADPHWPFDCLVVIRGLRLAERQSVVKRVSIMDNSPQEEPWS
jgi:hypothetical protein